MTAADVDEHAELRTVARDVLASSVDSESVRRVMAEGGAPDRDLIGQLAALGWFGIALPEEYGGGGAGFPELCVILEELGYSAASAPVASSALCALAINRYGDAEQRAHWLPGLGAGEILGAAVLGRWPSGATPPSERPVLTSDGTNEVLDGTAEFVLDARVADVLVVCATTADGEPVAVLVETGADGVQPSPRAMTDATRPVDDLRFVRARIASDRVLARGDRAADLTRTIELHAAVAIAADSTAVARRVVEMTTRYVKERVQFGRPVGSFQAVKHRAADMFVSTQAAALLIEDACDELGRGSARAAQAASMAKEYACATAVDVAGAALQLHGGIGYTWEHDLHIFFKRALLNDQLFGSGRWHRARVAELVTPSQLPLPSMR